MHERQDRQRSTWRCTSGLAAAVVLEHLLHQVDAAARAVALVAEQHVGGAGGGAEAAVHAAAQDLVDLGDARVLQLLWP